MRCSFPLAALVLAGLGLPRRDRAARGSAPGHGGRRGPPAGRSDRDRGLGRCGGDRAVRGRPDSGSSQL